MRSMPSVRRSWRERPLIRIDDKAWLLWAALLLVLPMKWLLAALTAACIHEVCHMAAVLLAGGNVRRMTVAPFGAVIEAEGISGLREALCALAGPLGSFLLGFLIHRFPLLSLCGLVQGAFNLLPVYPMDGGRALLRLLEAAVPERAERLSGWVERSVLILLLSAAVTGAVRYALGIFPVLLCILAILKAILRKRP